MKTNPSRHVMMTKHLLISRTVIIKESELKKMRSENLELKMKLQRFTDAIALYSLRHKRFIQENLDLDWEKRYS